MKVSKRTKKIKENLKLVKEYSLSDAVKALKENSTVKFNESLDCAIRLGVDPKHADQMVRGTVSLPHGTGKEVKVLVITNTGKAQEALEAGADYAGFEEYLEKIKEGWTDIDVIIASPEAMGELGKLGRILGPRGLMPNPKTGTVTSDFAKAVKEVKAGKIDFRVDKTGIVHASLGKLSFDETQLVDNVTEFLKTIMKLKPASSKGTYVKSLFLSSTMGPGLQLAKDEVLASIK
jgi:large subunit ribosomal protein L1